MPFIAGVSKKIKNFLKKTNIIKIAYKGINKLYNYIRVQKDKLPHTDVVYKIECKDCDASYVDQTGRILKRPELANTETISIKIYIKNQLSEHRLEQAHNFDWDNVKMLEIKKKYKTKDS